MTEFKTKTEIINFLIANFSYQTYLEIGVQGTSVGFSEIKAPVKIGIDPIQNKNVTFCGTSDNFFAQNEVIFDIVLIDGLHEHEQVLRDIENSLKFLSPNGTIVMHDCNPTTEAMQKIPRIQDEWTGDTWKAFIITREKHQDLTMFVINTDYGVGIISRSDKKYSFTAGAELNYNNFVANRTYWLNLIKSNSIDISNAMKDFKEQPKTEPIEDVKYNENIEQVKEESSDIQEIDNNLIKIKEIYNSVCEIIYLYNTIYKNKAKPKKLIDLNILKSFIEHDFIKNLDTKEVNIYDSKDKKFQFSENIKLKNDFEDEDIIAKYFIIKTKQDKLNYIDKKMNQFKAKELPSLKLM